MKQDHIKASALCGHRCSSFHRAFASWTSVKMEHNGSSYLFPHPPHNTRKSDFFCSLDNQYIQTCSYYHSRIISLTILLSVITFTLVVGLKLLWQKCWQCSSEPWTWDLKSLPLPALMVSYVMLGKSYRWSEHFFRCEMEVITCIKLLDKFNYVIFMWIWLYFCHVMLFFTVKEVSNKLVKQ